MFDKMDFQTDIFSASKALEIYPVVLSEVKEHNLPIF